MRLREACASRRAAPPHSMRDPPDDPEPEPEADADAGADMGAGAEEEEAAA